MQTNTLNAYIFLYSNENHREYLRFDIIFSLLKRNSNFYFSTNFAHKIRNINY